MKDSDPAAPELARGRARALRAAGTEAERRLWARLRNRQLNGVKFRRPHPSGGTIADFFCLQARLVIEVDGGQHGGPPECGATLSMTDLPLESVPHPGQDTQFVVRLGSTVHEVERELIVRTIEHAGGNKTRAAQMLGVGVRTLYRRLERYAANDLLACRNGDGTTGRSNSRAEKIGPA